MAFINVEGNSKEFYHKKYLNTITCLTVLNRGLTLKTELFFLVRHLKVTKLVLSQ